MTNNVSNGQSAKAEKKVKIRIPLTRENTADVYVSVNDRDWLIKRGEEVEVPECVVEVLRNQEIALEKAYNFNESLNK
jgi:hypothetical protein